MRARTPEPVLASWLQHASALSQRTDDMTFGRLVVVSLTLVAADCFAVTYQQSVPGVNGFTTVDKITWKDSKGLDRELFFARSYPNSIVPQLMGYVTRLTWQPDVRSARIVAQEDPLGINASNAQGWGTTVMHMHYSQYGGTNPYFGSGFSATTNKRDGFDFVQGPLFLGAHHLVFRVTYKQYTTLLKPGAERKFVYVTIDWFIADGLDSVVYALTLDASRGYQTDSVAFLNNSLAPYSLVPSAPWNGTTDWAGGGEAPDGQSWGDFKTFVTNDMAHWTYGGANAVPFVWEWVNPGSGRGDAEAAYVQTETYAQKSAGESFASGQDSSGSHLPVYPDLQGEEFAYQLNFFDDYRSKRLTWGTRFGLLYGGGGSSAGYLNYSLALHLGKFSDRGVPALLDETARLHDGRITVQATVGALVTSGPEGSGNPTPRTWSPSGFNPVYRTWELQCADGIAALVFDTGAASYRRPVFVLHGYGGANLNGLEVRQNGAVLPASAYAASLDAPADELYVTLLSTLSGRNALQFRDLQATTPVASVSVTPVTATVAAGGNVTFSAEARDAQGHLLPGEPMSWSAVATAGTITSRGGFSASCAPGTYPAAVTARASNGVSGSATVTIVPGSAAQLVVSPSSSALRTRATQQFTAVVRDSCGNSLAQAVTWSAAPSAGSITAGGLFTASCSRGSYADAVTASSGSLSDSAAVALGAGELAQLGLSPQAATVRAGGSQAFQVALTDGCGGAVVAPVAWSTSLSGGHVDAGLFTAGTVAPAAGTVSVSSGAFTRTAAVSVVPGAVTSVAVAPAMVTLAPGGTAAFTATARDAFGNAAPGVARWSTSAGTITQAGDFTASSIAGAYPTGVSAAVDAVSGAAAIVIQSGPLAQLVVSPSEAQLEAGATTTFSASGHDSSGNAVQLTPRWSVVAGGGAITAAGVFTAGTTAGPFVSTVRAEGDGVTAFATVRVTPGPVRSVVVTPGAAALAMGERQQFAAEARDAWDNVVPSEFTWSADPAAGLVSSNGELVAGTRPGRFQRAVCAKTGGVTGLASVMVTGGALEFDAGAEVDAGIPEVDTGVPAPPVRLEAVPEALAASGCTCHAVEGGLAWALFGLLFRRRLSSKTGH